MLGLFKDLNKLRPLLTRRDKWKFVFLFALMFCGSLLEAAGIGAIPVFVSLIMKPSSLSENRWLGEWFSYLPDEPTIQIMVWASILLFSFIAIKNLFLIFVFHIQEKIVAQQQLKLGDRMFKVYQSAPYEWYLQRSSSELLRNIQNDTTQILRGVMMPFLDLIMSLLMAGFIIAVMVWSMPGSALAGLLVTGFGLFVVIRLFQKHLQHTGKIVWQEHKGIIKAIQQGFGALVDARISGCEDYLSKIHRESLARQTKAQQHQFTMHKATPFVIETFAILGLLVILLLLIQMADSLASVLPIIVLLGVATVRLKQMASRIAAAINQMNMARAYIPTIINDLNTLDAVARQQQSKASSEHAIKSFDSLVLKNITYTYPDTEIPAIQKVSLQLNRGESIAFVGATGCGKSTLVNLILGLLKPRSGTISVNGIDIQNNIKEWRGLLGYIPQSVYLLDDSIRANIAFGVPENDVDEEQLWKALDSARLSDFIKTLPQGVNTIIGERGVRLSGGERQRLGIARAIYPNPEVLIMDEATSALDNKTEIEVMRAIQNLKKDRTFIMIAHRLSTVENSDRLYFLHEGMVESNGSYAELNQRSEAFRDMAMSKKSLLKFNY